MTRSPALDWEAVADLPDADRVLDLRLRVRAAMHVPPVGWECPARLAASDMDAPLPVRKARAIALKLSRMPTDLWTGQLFAGSMTLEEPRLHAGWGFPDYVTDMERDAAAARGLSIHSVFGHIVPDYPRLVRIGLTGIQAKARAAQADADPDQTAFLESVIVATEAVVDFAARHAEACARLADEATDAVRAGELRQMAANLGQVPAGPAQSFWQALQSVWLLHMVFHSTMDGNALGRLDQYAWPFLQADLDSGELDMARAYELVACFCLKYSERAKTTHEQLADGRDEEQSQPAHRTRHHTSSQLGTRRDSLDATNHWLQNIVVGGLTAEGEDGTPPLATCSWRRTTATR